MIIIKKLFSGEFYLIYKAYHKIWKKNIFLKIPHHFSTPPKCFEILTPAEIFSCGEISEKILKFQKIIGKGQQGVVWQAKHKLWECNVAVKTPHDFYKYDKDALSDNPNFANQLFEHELEKLKSLQNTPNIVSLLGWNTKNQWIIMKQYQIDLQSLLNLTNLPIVLPSAGCPRRNRQISDSSFLILFSFK